ncbi:MAG: T9SS type A sorting domain-containing protein [Phaeodactylibacter sp.]|uniref:DUF7619 domain-containing protein n=1 Tax=Phaeodactylibacter sp. TaxID=1940289 RepID=UPI0032EAFF91
MRRFILLFLLGLICSAQLLYAQGWRKTFSLEDTTGNVSYSLLRDVQTTADGGYLLYGRVFSGAQLALWKIDAYGNTQWSKSFGAETEAHGIAGNLHILGDSAIYISGRFLGTSQLPPQHGVMRLNMQGEVQWMERYFVNDTLSTLSTAFTPTADGHFITGSETRVGDTLLVHLHKIDQQGNVVWERTYPRPIQYNNEFHHYLADIAQLSDGGYIATGTFNLESGPQVAHLTRFDETGLEVLQTVYGNEEEEEYFAFAVEETTDGNYIFCGGSPGDYISPGFIKKVTPQGVEIWEQDCYAPATDIEKTSSGNYLVTGGLDEIIWYPLFLGGFVLSLNENGVENWNYIDSPVGISETRLSAITAGMDAGYVAVGLKDWQAYAIKLDSLGSIYSHTLQGTVQHDEDADCAFDSTAMPLSGWNITASDGLTDYYATTDSNGFYSMTVDTGSYTVSITPPNALWVPCQATVDTVLEGFYEETEVNFPVQTLVDCPLMSVDVSVPFLRRCFPNTYSVRYCNEGTAVANNAAVEIQLDEHLTLESAELPYSETGDQTYRFELGNLPPNTCGQFRFTAHLDCDETQLGQTHCVEALIFPDTLCVPTPPAPLIEADSRCDGDSVLFTLRNIGDADMGNSATYIVIEDDVMFLTQPFELEEGDSIEILRPATGATYRLQAPRRPGFAPGELISSTLEGCVSDNQVISLGFFNSFPLYGDGGFSDLECRANIGAYDPNDKQGFPTGAGPERFIEPATPLEYLIRFQNTGTDTAFYVAIRDTLSAWLDPATVTPGASSHPYTWRLGQDGTLLFEFDHIMLPDSNVNEPASHGFVKFGIDLKTNTQPGTAIHNQAAIFFDFNAPIITNKTVHRVNVDFLENLLAATEQTHLYTGKVKVAPNPASQVIRFEKTEEQNSSALIVIYNSNGQRLAVYPFLETEKGIRVDQWPNGLYLYEVRSGSDRKTGQFMIQR